MQRANHGRHRVHGVSRGGGQVIPNQIPCKIRSKTLEIMCLQSYNAYPDSAGKANPAIIQLNPSDPMCIRLHVPSAAHGQAPHWWVSQKLAPNMGKDHHGLGGFKKALRGCAVPKPDSGPFSGRFGSDSVCLPGCNSDFLVRTSGFRPVTL